jgi:hypothetical protein
MARNNCGLGFGPDRLRHIVGRIVGRIVFGRVVRPDIHQATARHQAQRSETAWAGAEHEPASESGRSLEARACQSRGAYLARPSADAGQAVAG